nr:hypothetical protein [Tanacetum cinerariifolium]
SSRVPPPFPEDPYEAIRKACLVETDTEFETYEDPIDIETLESPHTVASPTPLSDSTPPACHAEESEDSDTSDDEDRGLDDEGRSIDEEGLELEGERRRLYPRVNSEQSRL